MIHSVWNLCRACPGKPDEKVHTEYKRNYTWHSNYQPVQHDVIKKAPDLNGSVGVLQHAGSLELSLSRKKKHPEVAYRNHQVLNFDYPPVGDSNDSLDSTASATHNVIAKLQDDDFLRARSEERSNSKSAPSGPRSRSADPSLGGRKAKDEGAQEESTNKMSEYQLSFARRLRDHAGGVAAGLPSARRISQRSAFLLQGVRTLPSRVPDEEAASARKSISMGTIAQPQDDAEQLEDTPKRRVKGMTEYKAKFRPFSSYLYVDGNWRKTQKAENGKEACSREEVWDDEVKGGVVDPEHAWYTEVVERIKKADEYRWRAHGTPIYGGEQVTQAYGPGGATRQAELWSQVHDRTSLLALSLACSPKTTCRADDKTPDPRSKSVTKSPSGGVGVHQRRDIRPVSADRKKSPGTEKKLNDVAARKPRNCPPSATARGPNRLTQDLSRTGIRATSADPSSRRPKADERRSPQKSTPTKSNLGSSPSQSSRAARTPSGAGKPKSKEEKPRPVTRPSTMEGEPGKIWLKPSTASEGESPKLDGGEAAQDGGGSSPSSPGSTPAEARRPCTLPAVNGVDGQVNGQHSNVSGPSPLPEPHTGPVPLTTVRSPEEVTGVKSPDPESWTVPLETNKGLEWTDGNTPVEAARVKSPPLTSYKGAHLISNPQSSFEEVPKTSLSSFNMEEAAPQVATAVTTTTPPAAESVSATEKPESPADTLERARNRLDLFWSKSK